MKRKSTERKEEGRKITTERPPSTRRTRKPTNPKHFVHHPNSPRLSRSPVRNPAGNTWRHRARLSDICTVTRWDAKIIESIRSMPLDTTPPLLVLASNYTLSLPVRPLFFLSLSLFIVSFEIRNSRARFLLYIFST